MQQDKKILFIVPHRQGRSPGQRFRFEQYFDSLRKSGFEITVSNLLDEYDDKIFYSRGKYLEKCLVVGKSLWKRYNDLLKADQYDIIFIYREAIMLGTTWFEEAFSKLHAKIIFDLDDAIWLKDVSEGNKDVAFLKKPDKTFKILQLADLVIAGNEYIARKCRSFNSNVYVIPTTIDMSYHVPAKMKKEDKICIGWTGTETTLKHFESVLPVLEKIYREYSPRVYFKIICDKRKDYPSLQTTTIPWSYENEIKQLNEFDIGIMPLPDNEWTRSKCGFKALQYLALEVPAVVSAVGVNRNIVDHGINGYLASTYIEWYTAIERLILSPENRILFGMEGRSKVYSHYSKRMWANEYTELFETCLSSRLSSFQAV